MGVFLVVKLLQRREASVVLLPSVFRPLQKKDVRKGGKSKKTQLKFSIDCSTPVEDEIMDAGAFVSDLFMSTSLLLCITVYRVRVTFPSPNTPSPLLPSSPPPPLPPLPNRRIS